MVLAGCVPIARGYPKNRRGSRLIDKLRTGRRKVMILDSRGNPIQVEYGKTQRESLTKTADSLRMPSFSGGLIAEALGAIGDLRESCGAPRFKGGRETIKFRKYKEESDGSADAQRDT